MIKLADLLKEFVTNEARLPWHDGTKAPKLGKIYHNTNFKGMASIIKDGMVLKEFDGICFSRAKKFWKDSDVRIIVDGKKLSEKYDIQPYDWVGDTNEWEERCINTPKADISDCVLKVLLKPNEQTKEDWINDYIERYTTKHKEALVNWPNRLKHFKSIGLSSKEIKDIENDTSSYIPSPDEAEKRLRAQSNFKGDLTERYLPDIIQGLKAKGIPYEITDNFPAVNPLETIM